MLPPKITQTSSPTRIISSQDIRLVHVTTLLPSICWSRAIHNPQESATHAQTIPKSYTRFSKHHSLIHKKVQISQYTRPDGVARSYTNYFTHQSTHQNEWCPLREIRLVLIVKLLPSAELRQMQTIPGSIPYSCTAALNLTRHTTDTPTHVPTQCCQKLHNVLLG